MKQCPNCKVFRVPDDHPYKICEVCSEAKKRWYRKKHGKNGKDTTLMDDRFKVGKFKFF